MPVAKQSYDDEKHFYVSDCRPLLRATWQIKSTDALCIMQYRNKTSKVNNTELSMIIEIFDYVCFLLRLRVAYLRESCFRTIVLNR